MKLTGTWLTLTQRATQRDDGSFPNNSADVHQPRTSLLLRAAVERLFLLGRSLLTPLHTVVNSK